MLCISLCILLMSYIIKDINGQCGFEVSIIQQACSHASYLRWGSSTDEKTRCCSLWDNIYCLRERLKTICVGRNRHIYDLTINGLRQSALSDGCYFYSDRDYCRIFPVWAIVLIVVAVIALLIAVSLLIYKFCVK